MALLDRLSTLADAGYEYALARLRPARGDRGDALTAPAPWTDRDVQVLGSAATPETITRIITNRNRGELRDWADLADAARRSFPVLHAELATREQSVQETDFDVVPGTGSNQRAARRAADACKALLTHWRAREDQADEYGSWERWVAQWTAAAYYPLAADEVVWMRDGALVVPESCARIAERRLSLASDVYDPNPWAPRLLDDAQANSPFFRPPYGVRIDELHRDKIVLHRRRVVGGHQASEGLFAVLVWFWFFNTASWRDLMRLQEMLGVPPVVGYYAAGGAKEDGSSKKMNGDRKATKQELDLARSTLQMMTGALRALLPDTITLETLKYDLPTSPVQLATSERIEKMVARVVNGTDGVSSIVPGSRAAQQVAAEQAMTPYRADCRYAARVATLLFARYVRANPDTFGASCPLPLCVARTDPPKDPAAMMKLLADAQKLGFRIPEAWAHEATTIPVPGLRERVLGDPPEGTNPDAPTQEAA